MTARALRPGMGLTLMSLWMLPASLWAAEARAPAEPVGVGNLLQVMVGLIVVLAAVFALAWLLRRVAGFQQVAGGELRVLGALSMGQRERVVLVQVGREQLLLGVAPGRVQTLHVLPEPIAVEVPAGGQSFADRLQSAMRRGRS